MAAQPKSLMAAKPKVEVRNLLPGEGIPAYLQTGLHELSATIDPDWVWIATFNSIPCGALVAAPAHGIVFLLRLAIYPKSPVSILLAMLRKTLATCHQRGYSQYVVMLEPNTKQPEAKLLKLALRAGAKVMCSGVMLHGPTSVGEEW